MKKMLIRILLDLFLIVLGTVLVTGFLSLKPKRMPIILRPADLGLRSQEVIFQTRDGKTLKGWFISSEKARGTIIGCHGYPRPQGGASERVAAGFSLR